MDLSRVYVFDIETNGLLNVVNKLHVLSVAYKKDGKWATKSTKDFKDIQKLFGDPNNTLVGHNIIMYDIPALQKLFPELVIKANLIDTLGLSWTLYSNRLKHGLEDWGQELGFNKVKIDKEEWENLSFEKAVERCETDCIINGLLWDKIYTLLFDLYGSDEAMHTPILTAVAKLTALRVQEENPILIDIKKCQENLDILQEVIDTKAAELVKILPKIPKKTVVNFPKKGLYKADGSLSVAGEKYLTYVKGCGLPLDYDGPIEVIKGYEEPNPQSTSQVKDFLLSKGWKPKIFKKGANGQVPQLRDDEKNLCKSITAMVKKYPELESLEGMSTAMHRAGYLKAFLELADESGYIPASAAGFAKSWRLKHRKPFVNLPKPSAQFGQYVRSVMIAPEGHVFIGSDLSSLEDKCKQISIYSYDKDYVEQMNMKGFDAHLDIAIRADLMDQDTVDFYRWYKKREGDAPGKYKDMSEEELHIAFEYATKRRAVAKTANYSLTYGCAAPKLAESADIPLKEAQGVHKTYWDRNWAIKKYAEDRETKHVDDREWIYSPYSKLWLELSSNHVRFSICNQNFGAKVFDLWEYFCIKSGLKPIFQAHDEQLLVVKDEPGAIEEAKAILFESIEKVNRIYNHPIKFEIDVQVGKSYSSVH